MLALIKLDNWINIIEKPDEEIIFQISEKKEEIMI